MKKKLVLYSIVAASHAHCKLRNESRVMSEENQEQERTSSIERGTRRTESVHQYNILLT